MLLHDKVLRIIDVCLALVGLLLCFPLLVLLILVGWFDSGSPVFRQNRIGKDRKEFVLIKLRTMHPDTPSVGTHHANPTAISRYGKLIRRIKLDELPQLVNVLFGDMSLVGPRPSLPSQLDVIHERVMRGVLDVRPGITGLAQLRGIDMSVPRLLAETDAQMLRSLTIGRYFIYLFLTITGRGSGDRIRQS